MRQFLISLLMIFSSQFFAQVKVPTDFKFTTPFHEALNNYIVFSPRPEDKDLSIGVPYFDPSAGYSYRYFGTLKFENGKLSFAPADANSSLIARWQNLDLKVAVLSNERVKEIKLPLEPEFLISYQTDKLDKDFLVDQLGFQNGTGYSNLALPKLEQLRKENYQSEQFYFELAFAYNALNQPSKAEEVIIEAEKNNFKSELLIKEMHYALLHQNKLIPAADYLQRNFKNFKSKNYKSESIVNQIINFSNQNDHSNTEKWIKIYRSEIGEDQFKPRVDDILKKLRDIK